MANYSGHCYCNTVKFECVGEPLFTQHCHCNKCREIAALSSNEKDKTGYSFTAAYLTTNFHITHGKDELESVVRNHSTLWLCGKCKSLIYGISLDPDKQAGIGININDFNFTTLPDSFKPVRHIWYADRIVEINDDLPKFKDAPKEQFGSGELIAYSLIKLSFSSNSSAEGNTLFSASGTSFDS